MPIVFVHGVNTRRDDTYTQTVAQRNAYLRAYVLPGLTPDPAQAPIFNPYWGEWAATLAWQHASLPDGGQETLGADGADVKTALSDQAMLLTAEPERTLLQMARSAPPESLIEVVDLLVLQATQSAADAQPPGLLPLAQQLYQYVTAHPQPEWLASVADDEALLQRLQEAVAAWQPGADAGGATEARRFEQLGGASDDAWQALRWGAIHVQQACSRLSGQVVSAGRTPIQKTVSIFLGDVFKYLQMRGEKGQPGPIVQAVVDALEAAVAAKTAQDPRLLVIAHSMGGNICYDILSHYRPDLAVDTLVTVGSQVALFEELKLFHLRLPNVPGTGGSHVPKPRNIGHWLNIYNTNDVLSFACEGVFADVTDYEYPAGSLFGMRAAHSLYFERISFYERLAYRLRRLWS